MKVVAPEGEPCILPGAESYEAFMELASAAPNWRNEVTLESLLFKTKDLKHLILSDPMEFYCSLPDRFGNFGTPTNPLFLL